MLYRCMLDLCRSFSFPVVSHGMRNTCIPPVLRLADNVVEKFIDMYRA